MKDIESLIEFITTNGATYCIFIILAVIWTITFVINLIKKFLESLGVEIKTKRTTKLENELNEINKKIDAFKAVSDRRTVVSLRSTIYRMHEEFTAQGYVTREGLHTFTECVDEYEKAGGNDIVHEKLKPEVLALPVR